MIINMKNKAQSNIPNKETLKAFKEIEKMKKNPSKYRTYSNTDELMKDIIK